MSFGTKPNRPDSKDTARLRAEYEKKAQEYRDSSDPATKAKLKDEKAKLFGRVVQQISGERKENLSALQKVLIGMGKMKSDAQIKEERAKLESQRAQRVGAEGR